MNISNLPDAPWIDTGFGVMSPSSLLAIVCEDADVREFIVVARSFIDVCFRRGWSVRRVPLKKGWVVVSELDNSLTGIFDTVFEAWQGAVEYDAKIGRGR